MINKDKPISSVGLHWETTFVFKDKWMGKSKSHKEKLHLKPLLSMFCALSQNYQHFFENRKTNKQKQKYLGFRK